MGDTFTDNWDPPEVFAGWQLGGRDITKWDGNFYLYRPLGSDNMDFFIQLRSHDQRRIRLTGEIHITSEEAGLDVSVEVRYNNEKYGYWDDPKKALTDIIAKAVTIKEHLAPTIDYLRQNTNGVTYR